MDMDWRKEINDIFDRLEGPDNPGKFDETRKEIIELIEEVETQAIMDNR